MAGGVGNFYSLCGRNVGYDTSVAYFVEHESFLTTIAEVVVPFASSTPESWCVISM